LLFDQFANAANPANWATPFERSCGDEGADEKEDATFDS